MISIMLSTLQIIYICGNFDQVRVQNAIGDIYEIVQRMLGKSEENGFRYANVWASKLPFISRKS